MKRTVFTHLHEKAGAKLVDFAGFEMPVQFTSVIEEHKTVREKAGMFDVSHMGEIWIKGKEALKLIQYLTTNDASVLLPGQIQYTCFPNGKGGIVDDLILYHYSNNKYLLVVNASNIDKDYNWIVKNNSFDCEVENSSNAISQIALQGPKSLEILQKLTCENLSDWKSFTFKEIEVAGEKNVIVSTTGYTGAGGFELYFQNEKGEKIWNSLILSGEEYGIKPIGLAARDTLRLEMGYCLYGNDIDDTTSPLEAGLGWITKFNKEDFIDKEFMLHQKENGLTKKLVGFELVDKGIPRHDYKIVNSEGEELGKVTSGTMSPSLGKGIGMGYVSKSYMKTETEIYIEIRNRKLKAKVVKMPFYKG